MQEPAVQSGMLSVSALVRSVRDIIESRFPVLWITGEISNLVRARSGHSYFVLKDEQAQLRCVMFRHRSQYLDWSPSDGMQVEVQALVTLYEARGDLQLNIESMRRAGVGALYERFLKLRERLERQGLFAPGIKRELPVFPRAIGVITSLKAAALRDILATLKRRNPAIKVVIYPVQVQGAGAAAEIANTLGVAGTRAECDVLILARGGGSIEDLWAFNEEQVARAIRACPIPVVSGVGHETDVTIADLAADRRAPTPTAAAELTSPDAAELRRSIRTLGNRVGDLALRVMENRMQQLDSLARRLEHPRHRIDLQQERVRGLSDRLAAAWLDGFDRGKWRIGALLHRLRNLQPRPDEKLAHLGLSAKRLGIAARSRLATEEALLASLTASLDHLNPLRVLARGYSVVRDTQGRIVRSAIDLAPGDAIDVTLASGHLRARVERTS
ncbi:MAG: exodeoxyribonuclease VII large subunit [Betaproteobacteria bacterium]|nr:exodeoxyribonuclease VII large subunit [Betaproteobacteria bacterium]